MCLLAAVDAYASPSRVGGRQDCVLLISPLWNGDKKPSSGQMYLVQTLSLPPCHLLLHLMTGMDEIGRVAAIAVMAATSMA
mmetsp:Transcript_41578/g.88733  ORF Transcript_41578/g.88733 Transcript_41578/m.88733 type:complete len:81 (-) Transcript_41578:273-515(-)